MHKFTQLFRNKGTVSVIGMVHAAALPGDLFRLSVVFVTSPRVLWLPARGCNKREKRQTVAIVSPVVFQGHQLTVGALRKL